jgi:hypothetical protein
LYTYRPDPIVFICKTIKLCVVNIYSCIFVSRLEGKILKFSLKSALFRLYRLLLLQNFSLLEASLVWAESIMPLI